MLIPKDAKNIYHSQHSLIERSLSASCEVVYGKDGIGRVRHYMAFDPQYGPESEEQLNGTKTEAQKVLMNGK